MKDLILDLIPHAPQMGLYVTPHIPKEKRANAIRDYARQMQDQEVLALYDATLMGNARDGAIFAADHFIFQNNNLEDPQLIHYADLVHVEMKAKFMRGKKVYLDVNRGRATVNLALDFSGRPDAAEYIERFLHEAMMRGAEAEMKARATSATETDPEAVRAALDVLRQKRLLSDRDYERLLAVLR